ncbi:MAG TPA: DUF427 domain-containing protein, partial [Microthrixaceae bacterium]|nr:DUF427 domain-containing protein [Microthrixaceae bacterium]
PQPAGRFSAPLPEGVVYVEPFPRRVRARIGDRWVLDSDHVLLVHRPGAPPTYAFPAADVTGVVTEPEPGEPGHVRVEWSAVDAWFEEEQEVFGHPRNPYHRVDCVPTKRRLTVRIGDTTLVDTDDTTGVYETSLAPRLYVDPVAVRTDLLVPSPTLTYCPYKGTASHWSATIDGELVADVAWSYEDPLPECLPIKGMLAFYDR